MRTLYMCRHAKSSWSDPHVTDHDRPLNDRGQRDAPFMAKIFRDRKEPLDLLVSSTATRAAETARQFAQVLDAREGNHFDPTGGRPQLLLREALYHATTDLLLRSINDLPDEVPHVMLFGHNPGATALVDMLCSTDLGNLPTCGMVRIDFPFDSWTLVSRDTGTAVWQDFPKHHLIPG